MDAEALEFLAQLEEAESGRNSTNEALVPSGERECPICKKKMEVEIQEGISIDTCAEHGIWLDRGELGNMLAQVRAGSFSNRREALRRAKRDGKVSGMMLGAWSLMYD